jgi:hypothetical protein
MSSHPQELPDNLIGFLRAVKSHWVSLVSGGTIIVLLGVIERLSGRNVPSWVYLVILGLFILMACYLAWRASQTELLKLGNKEARERDFLMARLRELIRDYNQIDEGMYASRDFANSGKVMKSRAYHERVRGFLEQHFGNSAVEEFKRRRVGYLEELLGKLMKEQLASTPSFHVPPRQHPL